MRNLKDIIQERLHITKDTGAALHIEPISTAVYNEMNKDIEQEVNDDFEKSEKLAKSYKRNNDNPRKFIKPNKKISLLTKWLICIRIKWNEGIETLADEIIKQTNYTLEDLHGYCLHVYNKICEQQALGSGFYNEKFIKIYINYFKLYDIDYE